MVLSQSSDKQHARSQRAKKRSQRSLSSRNRRNDAIKKRSSVQMSRLPASTHKQQSLLEKKLIVNLPRLPVIEELIASRSEKNEKEHAEKKGKDLRVIIQRNSEDSSQKTNEKNKSNETEKKLIVQLERSSQIEDMMIFSKLKSTVLRTARKRRTDSGKNSPSSQATDIIGTVTPLMSPDIWPATPSPAIRPNILTFPMNMPLERNQNHETPEGTDGIREQAPRIPERRRSHAVVPHRKTYRHAIVSGIEEIELLCSKPHRCGTLTDICQYCYALFYTQEKVGRDGEHSSCCNRGSYSLPQLSSCPTVLKQLFTGDGPMAIQFRKKIRYVNSLFAMASFKTSRPSPQRTGQGHWSFTVCGQIYHFLQPIPNSQDLLQPQLNQLYFLDVEEALSRRNAFTDGDLDPELLSKIERCLRQNNKYIQAYKTMGEELKERKRTNQEVENIIIGITTEPVINILAAQQDPNWRPGRSDIAAIFEGSEPPINVDLVLYPHRADDPEPMNRHHELKLLNPMADPMVYPLLFPCGDDGFKTGVQYNQRSRRMSRRTVTILQYYRYRLHIRDTFSTLHHGGKLFQQYIVDGWIKNEMNRLWWLRQHQNELRRTAEDTLRRYNRNRKEGHVGKAIILPSGFPGGERYRHREYMDSMAIVARFGKPDMFITFTCNPNWPEVQTNLFPYQKWEDRPDLICRVFQMKLLAFMNDIVQSQLYGVVINHQYAIEFQKRGLPHAHIVLTFHEDDKLKTIEAMDKIICARIPDKQTQPLLYGRVRDFQLHAPCGQLNPSATCMLNGKCSKFYPKSFREQTRFAVGHNKTPEYRRPADGREIHVEKWNRSVNNRRVVPYNAYALAKYNCHINFEAVGSLGSIKYLHKYINKKPDSVTVYFDKTGPENQQGRIIDEIQDYIDSRYVSSMEATWRTFQFPIHKRSHSIMFLPVHLPGEREICYNEEDDPLDIEERLMKRSKLEAWFSLNQMDPEAKLHRYTEIPEFYVWNDQSAKWTRRQQKSRQFGRLQEVGTMEGQIEKFFLRLLLKRLKGATSYDDLLTLENGYKCSTFRESCEKRNWLIQEGGEYNNCLLEAELHYHPYRLRKLFALICCFAMDEEIGQIFELWQRFKKSLMADLRRNGKNHHDATETCIRLIQELISRSRPGVLLQDFGIEVTEDDQTNTDDENSYEGTSDMGPISAHKNMEKYSVSSLNYDQKRVFLRVLSACAKKSKFSIPSRIMEELGSDIIKDDSKITENSNTMFFVDGPGGTGKTHLYNTLIRVIQETLHENVIAVAWTGIAANILIGGTTVHRAFKLPLTLTEESTCGFEIQSSRTEFIKKAALIIWDEAPMTPRFAMETVDRYLKDIMRRFEPMGGKCVLFGGDFRQILPVVPGGKRSDIIFQCLKASILWPKFVKLTLNKNMRLGNNPGMGNEHTDLNGLSFDRWLLQLGNGKIPFVSLNKKAAPIAPEELIEIPKRFQVSSMEELIQFVYNDDYTGQENGTRAILCPTNAIVDCINTTIIKRIEDGAEKIYMSEDSVAESDENDEFSVPIDLLNSMNPPSLPPHELVLKCGAIVMLLRNLDVDEGQCNGSRMRVIRLGDHTIECELLTGQHIGEKLILPKIKMKVQVPALPREMIRSQFPIRLAYGVTINKSQGQTLNKIGICLKTPCFTHGQLYVAFSRVRHIEGVKIYIEDSGKQGTFKFRGRRRFTSNIVFHNIIDIDSTDKNGDERIQGPTRIQLNGMEDQNMNDKEHSISDSQFEESDPDYTSDKDNTNEEDDNLFDNPDLDNLMNTLMDQQNRTTREEEFWKEAVPFRTRSQLEARISKYDQPGTSGLYISKLLETKSYSSDSESD